MEESGRSGAHRYAHGLELFEIRWRNMLMIKGDDIEPTGEAHKIVEGIV
jgi:hypothetical protein